MTPEEIGQNIAENIPYECPEIVDEAALGSMIATAIRDAYECAAAICDTEAGERRVRAVNLESNSAFVAHYFDDMRAAYQRAARLIRALKDAP